MTDVFIAAGARSPFGKLGGRLKDASQIQLGATVLRAVLDRGGAVGQQAGELIVGMGCFEGGHFVPARQILIGSQLPVHTPSLTVDRACCSGMTAIGLARRDLLDGSYPAAAVVGVDVLSGTPYLLPQARWGTRHGDFQMQDPLAFRAPFLGDVQIARYTGEEAIARGCGREAQDEWAARSHERYGAALAAGRLDGQVLRWEAVLPGAPPGPGGARQDEQYRPEVRRDRLAALPTVYGSPTVTAGNAPGLNDGAAAAVLTTAPPELSARVVDYLQIAGEPTAAVYLPGRAVLQILARNDIGLGQVHAIEINEAYAATPLCSIAEISQGADVPAGPLADITNAWGGAIACGHPLGASGVRIVLNLIDQLAARGGGIGVAAICGGFGQTDAVLLRVG